MTQMRVVEFGDGIAIRGTFPDSEVVTRAMKYLGNGYSFPLAIWDPPYGNIVGDDWDKVQESDVAYAKRMVAWAKVQATMCCPGAAFYVWGGVGLPRRKKKTGKGWDPPFRPFFRFLLDVELETEWNCSSPLTWKKKRAYGIAWGFLFTREECLYMTLGDVRKPRRFEIPLLEQKRGYEGYDKDHPAKSEFFRRTNVWTDVESDLSDLEAMMEKAVDPSASELGRSVAGMEACARLLALKNVRGDVWDDITEILRGKVHEAQKPRRLMEIPIEVHTNPDEVVFDPFVGSGTTAHAARHLGRRFVVVERDEGIFDKMVASLKG
jgi:hypothetical protein